ncbi:MAG: DUF192 domain-containing protein [Spirochaetia bacterium]|jgi:uncharacterized membrane protein (UPF0127 family)|nr:DUF192 domain-containing protein [Spirochaetia bacterium]
MQRMNMVKQLLLVLSLSMIFFTACSDGKETVSITVGKDIYNIEIAVSREEQSLGLMNREKIEENEGMIFLYREDRKLSFWMKNTYIPLSIAFIAKNGTIKEIHNMKPESLTPVKSIHSVRYALELPLGAFERSGVGIGDIIILPALITDY